MLSEVVVGRVGTPRPVVQMLAPVVIGGRYAGYVTGILSLKQIADRLGDSVDLSGLLYSLLDRNGKVIMSNRPNQAIMQDFQRGEARSTRSTPELVSGFRSLPPIRRSLSSGKTRSTSPKPPSAARSNGR